MAYTDLIDFARTYCRQNMGVSKEALAATVAQRFGLRKQGAAFVGDSFGVRFSSAAGNSFSNTVCSLKTLLKVDRAPFLIVLVTGSEPQFFLANTTLLKKISHSSHKLRVDNIRGSFNGTDILREYDGLANVPANFETLFAIHQEFTREENLERLVEATNNIVGRAMRFLPTEAQIGAILRSPSLAAEIIRSAGYRRVCTEMAQIVAECSAEILSLATIDNVNIRGNRIEQSITGGINKHHLGDMIRNIETTELQLEIKTKLMDRASCPKAFNVDKALEFLSGGRALIAYCFVGLHLSAGRVTSSIVSIFDRTVVDATLVQFHWAGRNSRGVTQLSGDLSRLFAPDYQEQIDVAKAVEFLNKLINL
jgi:hypothetical protein